MSSGTGVSMGRSIAAGKGGGGIFVGVEWPPPSAEMWCCIGEGRPLEVIGGGGLNDKET
jgi:hypothetical protein